MNKFWKLSSISLHPHAKFNWNQFITSWDILITAQNRTSFNSYLTSWLIFSVIKFSLFVLVYTIMLNLIEIDLKSFWDILITAKNWQGHILMVVFTPVTLTFAKFAMLLNFTWVVWSKQSYQIWLKLVDNFLRYFDYSLKSNIMAFDPSDFDLWKTFLNIKLGFELFSVYLTAKFDFNWSIISWDIILIA